MSNRVKIINKNYKDTDKEQLLPETIDTENINISKKDISIYEEENLEQLIESNYNDYIDKNRQGKTSKDNTPNLTVNKIIPNNSTESTESGEIIPLNVFQEVADYFLRITSTNISSRELYANFIRDFKDTIYARPLSDFIKWREFERKDVFYDEEFCPPVLKIEFVNDNINPKISLLCRNVEVPYRRFWLNATTAIFIYPEYLLKNIPLNTINGIKLNIQIKNIKSLYVPVNVSETKDILNISDAFDYENGTISSITKFTFENNSDELSNLNITKFNEYKIKQILRKFTPKIEYNNGNIIFTNYNELEEEFKNNNIEFLSIDDFTPICVIKHNTCNPRGGRAKSRKLFRMSIIKDWSFNNINENDYSIENSGEFIANYEVSKRDRRYRRIENDLLDKDKERLSYVFVGIKIGLRTAGTGSRYTDYILSRRSNNSIKISKSGEREISNNQWYI